MAIRLAFILIASLLLASPTRLSAADDSENSTPTAWWIYTGQSFDDIQNTISAKSARITAISPDNSAGSAFTVTYVQNSGAFAKQWWWYVGIDAATVTKNLTANKARLISLKAYDTGGGKLRFAVAMIANTGADSKGWWWYYGKSTTDITNLSKTNNARLVALQSYNSNGQTVYSCIMIANKGADAKGWWWYYNETPQDIEKFISTNKARLLDITASSNNRFNVAMESCSGGGGCPGWWWYYGLDVNNVLAKAQTNGARVMTAQTYQGCNNGSNRCLAVSMISNTPPDVTACDLQGCISEAKLSANICGTLANKVVGYSCEVGAMRPAFGGQARTAADAPAIPMSPDLVTNIASVSKTMTAVAILQLLSKAGVTVDSKISPYLYNDWTKGSNIDKITFKQLLTHTSGFGQLSGNACGSNTTYSQLKSLVANGVQAANMGKPQYGNCNFVLLRELMPALSGQPLNGIGNDTVRAQTSSTMYINYMNSHVFQPVGVPVSACKPPSGTNDILSYPYPPGSTKGTDWGDWSLMCGSGGWVLSGDQIFRVMRDVATGSTLLTTSQRKQMLSNCLGWDCAVRNDCPSPNVCKNGDLNQGPGGRFVWTYAGILKCNVPVVVVVNSPLPAPFASNGDIIGLVANALKNSSVPGAAKACP